MTVPKIFALARALVLACAILAAPAFGQSSPTAASKTTTPLLAGKWRCIGRPGPASIRQQGEKLTFTNEQGMVSPGHFDGASHVVAEAWEGGLKGTISKDANTISWANATTWKRVSARKASASQPAATIAKTPPASSYVNLSGNWTCIGRPGPASIKQNGKKLTFTNEQGMTSQGYFRNARTVVATNWEGGLRGAVSADGKKISWANSTTWVRADQPTH